MKVFISYSWSSDAHEQWVLHLASQLVSDGIDVVLDKWDLKEGQDTYEFMEQMVDSQEIAKVLLIVDGEYANKANLRRGGVGTETQIVSPEIYTDTKQEKFVPIVVQPDTKEKVLPTYLKGRLFIDFSNQDDFDINYEKLIRNIYDKPLLRKPKLGKTPTYILSEEVDNFKTSSLARRIDQILDRNPERINYRISDFLETFLSAFDEQIIHHDGSRDLMTIGEKIINKMRQYDGLRNDYVSFLIKIFKSQIQFDNEIFVNFFESILNVIRDRDNQRVTYPYTKEHFKISIWEIFILTIAIALRYKQYNLVSDIFYSKYIINEELYQYRGESQQFDIFYYHAEAIDHYYKETTGKNLHNSMVDFFLKRLPTTLNSIDVVTADYLCYYVCQLNGTRWFPQLYIYGQDRKLEFFRRFESRRFAEKAMIVFNVKNLDELKVILKNDNENNDPQSGYHRSFSRIFKLSHMIDLDKLGQSR